MQLWQKKIVKVYIFYITQSVSPPKQVYQSHCDHDLYTFKHVQTL